MIQRLEAHGNVVTADRITKQRIDTAGGISATGNVVSQREYPTRGVALPVPFLRSAPAPRAVFWSAVLARSVVAPTPVLRLPMLFENSECQPSAVFPAPLVRLKRALSPSAVLKLGYAPSGVGTTACADFKSAMSVSREITIRERVFIFI